ncbi:MAG: hypothetical protein ABEJ61_03070 [Haloferacaceae archaeon]
MHELTRRRLIAAGTAGIAGALAGCSDTSPTPPGAGNESGSGGGNGGTATPTPTATTKGPQIDYPDLAKATETIVDSIVWHATSYDQVMTQLRVYGGQISALANDLRAAESVTQNDLEQLESRTTGMATYVGANVQPYYPVTGAVLDGNNTYVQQVKLAAERGDPGALDTALQRLADFYGNYGRRSFIEEQFPNGPIYQKLFDRIRRGKGAKNAVFGVFHPASGFHTACYRDTTPEDPSSDGVPQHVHEWPSGHVVVTHTHGHDPTHSLQAHLNEPRSRKLIAYRDGQFDLLADDDAGNPRVLAYSVERADIFGPVNLPAERSDVVYLTVNEKTTDFDQSVVQIQTFESVGKATAAVESLLSADVFEQGTYPLVEDKNYRLDLSRIYYSHQGSTFYAYLLRVGRFVVTFSPSETEWGSRTDWPDEVASTWFADKTPLGDG